MIRTVIAALVAYVLVVNRLPAIFTFLASLDQAGFTFGAVWGFVFGMGIVIIGYRIIYNHLVENDRRNDHTGVDKKHDARRI